MAKNDSTLHKLKQDALAIWDERFHPEKELPRLHKFLHFWVLVVKSFKRNRCPIRASALSFTTLLALIPMLAVVISITSALLKKEGEQQIYQFVDKLVSTMVPPAPLTNAPSPTVSLSTNAPQASAQTYLALLTDRATTNPDAGVLSASNPPVQALTNRPAGALATTSADTNAPPESGGRLTAAQKDAARRIHEFIQNTRSGTLGTVGAILLVLVGIRMLRSIESTFNDIWGIPRCRNWLSSIQTYCTALVVGPLLLVGAAALTSGPQLESTRRVVARVPVLGLEIFPILTLLVLWLFFTLFYQLVPNTKVRFKAALIGGIVGGTIWHLNNLFGFLYVSRVVSNSRIYGSLGLVPVFMAGIYFSWLVLLFGAQVSYAFQNRSLYFQEKLAENVNQRGREFVALRLMTCVGQRFQRGLRPPTTQEMSEELCVPGRLVQQVLQTLVAAHLVIEVSGNESAYTPGRPLDQINAHHILQAMRARGQELLTRDEPVREEVYGEFARIEEAEKRAASSITMFALVNRADARLELAPTPAQEKPIEISPALAPAQKAQPEAAPQPQPQGAIRETFEPPKAQASPTVAETPEAKTTFTAAILKPPIAEPMADEEREFPL